MYEYATENAPGRAEALARLNEPGAAGWEAFGLEPLDAGYRLWLRRRLGEASNVARGLAAQR